MMKHTSMIFLQMMSRVAVAGSFLFASFAIAQTETVVAPENAAAYSIAPLLAQYPPDSIQSPETANSALKDVDEARDRIEERYVIEQHACYPKFFTTSCLDKVTERRRHDLATIRPIQVEANAYIRKAKVVERDRKLAEKAAENEADAAQRLQQGQDHQAIVRDKAVTDQQDAVSRESQRQKRADDAAHKKADHAAKEQQRQAHAGKDAQQRAENVTKYNKKVADAKVRQKEVADKKAQREQDRAAKAAKEAKQPSQTPAP
jgi:hypothetical protein